ncbi:hypothetical protein [Vallitalea longa]|nr:hypothetical protein [Vallitalea longa]
MKSTKIVIILMIVLMLTGCGKKTLEITSIANHTELVENSKYGEISMEFAKLDGEDIRAFSSKKGEEYKFEFNYLIKEGNLNLQFRDSQDNIISDINLSEKEYMNELEQLQQECDGDVNIEEFCRNIVIESSDNKIKVALIGEKAKGKIDIIW